MIESSVYVGATRELFGEFLERGVYVGFSPERVDPGRVEPPMERIPKVISGLNESSLQVCKNVYERVFDKVVPVSSCECAEMCKLYENCFRMINIAYVNEISDMCENIGINTYEMINASSSKPFGFMPFYPGIGVGGHCIPVNPYYLFKTGNLPVLEYATELMNRRPEQKADEIAAKYDCKNILLTGIGFKKGESLLTNSPGYELYKQLISIGKAVTVYDPIVQDCYIKNDIVFCSRNQFTLENLQDKYDLILVNLRLDSDEEYVINMYEKLGGKVHIF
jgi:nucleotide sugar dehydrogenase